MDFDSLGQLSERQKTMLRTLVEAFAADGRVLSCWLGGSLGRGEADAWSDIDINVLVQPSDMDDFSGEAFRILLEAGVALRQWAGLATESIRCYGAFFDDAILVDLMIQSSPPDPVHFSYPIRVVFGPPPAGADAPPIHPPADDPARHWPVFERAFAFWLEVLFAAKYTARGDVLMATGHLTCARATLVQVLDMSRAPAQFTPPVVLHATWGRLTPEERATLEATLGPTDTAALRGQIMALMQAADGLLTPLAVAAGCGDFAEQMGITVRAALEELPGE